MLLKQNIRVKIAAAMVGVFGTVTSSVVVHSQSVVDNASLSAGKIDTTDIQSVCPPGDNNASVLVHVENIATIEGNLRAQLYTDKEEDFLEKGKKLVRVEVPVSADAQSVCVPLPSTGNFSLVILHDKNANGKADFFSEGFGFSNNPKLRFGPPDVEDATFAAKEGITQMTVNLQYILGTDDAKKKKRRNARRR
ncbi:DUF2141 domain-containing protein [Kordiimonas sp. SCSIO 12610]|uniref:DUF2141 domain-containing protein n=1 Tax=Kordiimonas sp. SCSIO 12610 TaxID=2829597 RepID=UPI00210A3FCA|nr:DUF2141 domain-containing protein [Kordiimonas sp. SCSIO 12610]UTW56614.1 DUF2141 domain-containing protein [Kordiimonas sp. SCSIO 12610]